MPRKTTDQFGNTVTRDFAPGDRYHYDFEVCTPALGWKQFDTSQDASYFGIWVNAAERKIFQYCEGDTELTECQTEESFHAILKHMNEFYGPPPPAFTVIGIDGSVTKIYDERPA